MSVPQTQKAFIRQAEGDKPQLIDTPVPKPEKNQVLVKMAFAPINPADGLLIEGVYPVPNKPPHGIGMEGCGTVAAVGEDLKVSHQVGDKVHVVGLGTYGQYLITNSENCEKIQEGLSMEEAASHFVNPMTACLMANLTQHYGHKAAIHTAGSSTLGRQMIRYFKHKGVKLINIVRREEVIEELKKEGAYIVLNSKAEDFEAKLKEVAEKEGATVCFESIVGDMTGKILKNMPEGSTVHVYGALSDMKITNLGVSEFIFQGKTVTGFWLGPYIKEVQKRGKGEFEDARKEVLSLLPNVLASPILKSFELEKIDEALEFNSKNSSKGKTLLKLN